METTTTGAEAPSEVIIHAQRADQLVQLARSERAAATSTGAAAPEGSAVR